MSTPPVPRGGDQPRVGWLGRVERRERYAAGKRLATVAGRELRAQVTSPLFGVLLLWLLFLASALNPVVMVPPGELAVDGIRAVTNSAHALAPTFAIGGFFAYTFFAALFAAAAALRDFEVGIDELLGATPLARAERLGGQLAGVLGALGIALLVHVAAVAAVRELPRFFGVATAVGPFRPTVYLFAAVAFAAPWIALVAVVAFAAAERTRRAMVAYAVPITAFAVTLLAFWRYQPAGLDPRIDRLLILLDATAIRWLDRVHFAVDLGPAYYNSAAFSLDWTFVANRLLVAVVVAVAVARLLARPEAVAVKGPRRAAPGLAPPALVRPAIASGTLRELAMTRLPCRPLAVAATVARVELVELRRPPVLVLFTALLAAAVFDVAGQPTDLFGDPLRLSAGDFAVAALPLATILITLYLLFAVVESWERDEATGFAPLVAATPASDGALALGKGVAHGGVAGWLVAALVATGALALVGAGEPLEPGTLLLVFGLVLGPTCLVWIAFVSALHAATRSRAATLALGLTALVATGALYLAGQASWISNWPLFGALRWSDFGTFPLHAAALWWNRGLALGAAAFLFALSVTLRRRREPDPRARAARWRSGAVARQALRLAPLAAAPLAVAVLLAVRIEAGPEATSVAAARAAGARQAATFGPGFVPPTVRHLDLHLVLAPDDGTVQVSGSFDLVNPGARSMPVVPFTVAPAFGPVTWSNNGVAFEARRVPGVDCLALDPPLAPGASRRVGFAYRAAISAGYSRNGGVAETFVIPAAVSLSSYRGDLLPIPGFPSPDGARPGTVERAPVRGAMVDTPRRRDGYTFRLTVDAPARFRVSAVGDLVAETEAGGRRQTVWTSDVPVTAVSLAAAPYAIERNATAAVFHHPRHADAARDLLTVASTARARYASWFGPYPWREIRLAELPALTGQATAYPAHLAISELYGFRSPVAAVRTGGLPFRVVAHEIAHQWWGHLVQAGDGPGSGVLVEGLANWSTLRLLAAELGLEARAEFARDLEDLYLDRRRASLERPLLDTLETDPGGEAVLAFRGALVLDQLQALIGEDRMFAALATFVARHRAGAHVATVDELLAAVAERAPPGPAFGAIVGDWLAGTALPELHWSDVRVGRGDGGLVLHATLHNSGTGHAPLELAVYGVGGSRQARRTVQVSPASSTLVAWPLDFAPELLVADPDVELLQANRARSRVEIEAGRDAPPRT